MNRIQFAKIFALIAALLTGGATIMAGDMVSGVGIIAASLSSVTAVLPRKE